MMSMLDIWTWGDWTPLYIASLTVQIIGQTDLVSWWAKVDPIRVLRKHH